MIFSKHIKNYKNKYLPFRRNDEWYNDVKMCVFCVWMIFNKHICNYKGVFTVSFGTRRRTSIEIVYIL